MNNTKELSNKNYFVSICITLKNFVLLSLLIISRVTNYSRKTLVMENSFFSIKSKILDIAEFTIVRKNLYNYM